MGGLNGQLTDKRSIGSAQRLFGRGFGGCFGRSSYQQNIPLAGNVTTFTQMAEFTLVLVVLVVATATGSLDRKLFILNGQFVASVAARLFVSTIQLELGLLVMIEIPGFPRACIVAILTLLAQPLLMRLLFFLLVA